MPMNCIYNGWPVQYAKLMNTMIDEDDSSKVIQVFCPSINHIQGSLEWMMRGKCPNLKYKRVEEQTQKSFHNESVNAIYHSNFIPYPIKPIYVG